MSLSGFHLPYPLCGVERERERETERETEGEGGREGGSGREKEKEKGGGGGCVATGGSRASAIQDLSIARTHAHKHSLTPTHVHTSTCTQTRAHTHRHRGSLPSLPRPHPAYTQQRRRGSFHLTPHRRLQTPRMRSRSQHTHPPLCHAPPQKKISPSIPPCLSVKDVAQTQGFDTAMLHAQRRIACSFCARY